MILVIDPAVRIPEVQGFCKIVRATRERCEYHLPGICDMRSLEACHLDEAKGIVLFGSGTSVHETDGWQKPLSKFLQAAIDKGIPLMAICYGQQLLGHMFGAEVGFCTEDRSMHLGDRIVSIKSDKRLKLPELEIPIVVSHGEELKSLPKGFELWGETSEVEIEAIRHPLKPIWALQSHPEATEDFIAHQDIELNHQQLKEVGEKSFVIIQAFLNFCSETR